MSKAQRAFLTIVICVTFFLGSIMPVYAGFTDTAGHWAAKEISRWAETGLLKGNGNGSFRPDGTITRAEFLSIMCRLFKYVEKSETVFPDVKANAWYAGDISKAYAAGIVTGDDQGSMKPDSNISRQEAVVILHRAFSMKSSNTNALDRVKDKIKIAEWALDAACAMVENSYINGKPGDLFVPEDSLTRAEAVKIISNIVDVLKSAPGTYTGDIDGNLVVNSAGVTLNNMTISGSLYITQGVGDGEVVLNNVTVKGRTIVRGGGENSILLNNTMLEDTLVIVRQGGKIRIVARGATGLSGVELGSGARLVEDGISGTGFGNIEIIEVKPGEEIILDGDFESILLKAEDAKLEVLDGSVGRLDVDAKAVVAITSATVGTLNVNAVAAGAQVSVGAAASVTTFNANAETAITGKGKITTANISANNVSMEQTPEKANIGGGLSANLGGKVISGSSGGSDGGGSGGSGNSDGNTGGQESIRLAIAHASLTVAVGESVYAEVTADVEGTSLAFSSGNTGVATVDAAGKITGVSSGTAVITVTAGKSGYTGATSSISIEVIPRTAPGGFKIFPSRATMNTGRQIAMSYRPAGDAANGQVTFMLPKPFAVADGDFISLESESSIAITGSRTEKNGIIIQVSDSGRKVTVTNAGSSDIGLILKRQEMPSSGIFTFRAAYDEDGDGSAYLPSLGVGTEAGTIEVASTVSILGCYQENLWVGSIYMEWTTPIGAEKTVLQKRVSGEQDWRDVSGISPVADGEITWTRVSGLEFNTTYEFRLIVTGGVNAGESEIVFANTGEDMRKYGYFLADNGQNIPHMIKLLNNQGDKIMYTVADSVYSAYGKAIAYYIDDDGKLHIVDSALEKLVPDADLGGDPNKIDYVDSEKILLGDDYYYFSDETVIAYDANGDGGPDVQVLSRAYLCNGMSVEVYLKDANHIAVLVVTQIHDSSVHYGYSVDLTAIADNKYIIGLINKSGLQSLTTADSVYAVPGNAITYTVNGDRKINITNAGLTMAAADAIVEVDGKKIRLGGDYYYFTGDTIIVYDGDGDGSGLEVLTKTDLYKDMIVEIYMNDPVHIAILVVILR